MDPDTTTGFPAQHRSARSRSLAQSIRMLLAGMLIVSGTISYSIDGMANAFGPDGYYSAPCVPGSTPRKTNIPHPQTGATIGQIQTQFNGGCYYGVSWGRLCVKLWHSTDLVFAERYQAPGAPGPDIRSVSGEPDREDISYGQSCPGFAAWSYTSLLFNNCDAAGYSPCKVRSFGGVSQSGTYLNGRYTLGY